MMLNIASDCAGVGAAVLIRALAPEGGMAAMAARRGALVKPRDLLRGPGRLTQALAIDRTLDGIDLCAPGPLFVAHDRLSVEIAPEQIGVSPRIGITKAAEAPLRFYLRGSRFLSGPAWLNR